MTKIVFEWYLPNDGVVFYYLYSRSKQKRDNAQARNQRGSLGADEPPLNRERCGKLAAKYVVSARARAIRSVTHTLLYSDCTSMGTRPIYLALYPDGLWIVQFLFTNTFAEWKQQVSFSVNYTLIFIMYMYSHAMPLKFIWQLESQNVTPLWKSWLQAWCRENKNSKA